MVRSMQVFDYYPIAPDFETIGITEENGINRNNSTLQFFCHGECDFGVLRLRGTLGKSIESHDNQEH